MTPEMIYTIIGLACTIGGALVHRYAIAPTPPAGPPNGVTPATPAVTPGVPGRISIGHGELLGLLLSAFNSPPPASGMPSTPTPAVSQPAAPPSQHVDLQALLDALLARLAIPPSPTPALASSAPSPVKA